MTPKTLIDRRRERSTRNIGYFATFSGDALSSMTETEMKAEAIARAEAVGLTVTGEVTLKKHQLYYESRRNPELDWECVVATVEVTR